MDNLIINYEILEEDFKKFNEYFDNFNSMNVLILQNNKEVKKILNGILDTNTTLYGNMKKIINEKNLNCKSDFNKFYKSNLAIFMRFLRNCFIHVGMDIILSVPTMKMEISFPKNGSMPSMSFKEGGIVIIKKPIIDFIINEKSNTNTEFRPYILDGALEFLNRKLSSEIKIDNLIKDYYSEISIIFSKIRNELKGVTKNV